MPINDEKRKINVIEWSVFKLSAVLLYYKYIYNVSYTVSEKEDCCLLMLLYHIIVVNRILLYTNLSSHLLFLPF